MKKLCFVFACLFANTFLQAQSYSFTSGSQPYVETTDQSIMDTTFSNYLSFSPENEFKLFGETITNAFTAGTTSGYLVASNNDYGFALDPMNGTRLRKIEGKSKLTVTTLSDANDKILVVQWKDVGLEGHSDADFLNFQVRISLNAEKVLFHYGPSNFSSIPNDSAFLEPKYTGPEVFLVKLTADFNTLIEFNAVSGSRESPVFSGNYARMTNIPLANQVFSFAKKNATALSQLTKGVGRMMIYPNPIIDGKTTISATTSIKKVVLKNTLGQEVSMKQNRLSEKELELELETMTQPIWAEITLIDGTTIVKRLHIGADH
jgi:hypothetical protein